MPVDRSIADRLIAELLASEKARDYFFEKATSAQWLEPLWQAGFFQHPPDPIHAGDMVAFPRPYAAAYLARVAASAPNLVRRIIESADATENPRVHEEYVRAALAMPVEESIHLAEHARDWVAHQQYPLMRLPAMVAELTTSFAEGGHHTAATSLLRSLLDLAPGPPRAIPDDHPHYVPPDPQPPMALYEYEQILRDIVPRLTTAIGDAILLLLSDIVDQALDIERRPGSAPEDLSSIWRPAIEDHTQNLPHQLNGMLVAAERDCALQLLRTASISGQRLIDVLSTRRWKVHIRILLEVLAEAGSDHLDAVSRVVLDPRYIGNSEAVHELARLTAATYRRLPTDVQHRLLELIDEGPDTAWIDRAAQAGRIPAPTEEYRRRFLCRWRRDRLAPIRPYLDEERGRQYDQLVQEVGEPDPELLAHRTISYSGPSSPISAEEMGRLTDHELLDFLQRWAPPSGPMSPSREGVAVELQRLVEASPSRFSVPHKFRLDEPTYVRAILTGFREAIKARRQLDWTGALDLISFAIERGGQDFPGRSTYLEDGDPTWVFAKIEAGHLLSAGLDGGEVGIPLDLADDVWNVLMPLANDQDPTPEAEAGRTGSGGPMTLALNSVRGVAIAGVIAYALWLAKGKELFSDEGTNAAFEQIPHIAELLSRHLDSEFDQSLAVRSVYGQWFPWLALLDGRWTQDHVLRIFPEIPGAESYWQAAWEAYVLFNRPYLNVYPLLTSQYLRAVRALPRTDEGDPPALEAKLAEHVLGLYIIGLIQIDSELLRLFLSRSRPSLRRYMLFLAGRDLQSLSGGMREETADRLMTLWKVQRHAVESGRQPAEDLRPFGWWFASGRLPDRWSLSQLDFVIERGVLPEPDHLVLERLATLAQSQPRESVMALRRMLRLLPNSWTVMMWSESARAIATAGMRSNDTHTESLTRALVNELGQAGLTELRDVLL